MCPVRVCWRKVGGKGNWGELENDVSLPATPIERMTVDMAFAFSQLGLWVFRVLTSELANVVTNTNILTPHVCVCVSYLLSSTHAGLFALSPFPQSGELTKVNSLFFCLVSTTAGCTVQAFHSPNPPFLHYVKSSLA